MTSSPTNEAFPRVARVISGVVVAAARDACRSRLLLPPADSPEAGLLVRCLEEAGAELPIERVAGQDTPADALVLGTANKTVAVLWPETAREPVLPVADLYASQVSAFTGGWSAPPDAVGLIDRAGGIGAVDAFLFEHLDRRRSVTDAIRAIADSAAAEELRERLNAGWWWRRRIGLVPKLGARTLGIDYR